MPLVLQAVVDAIRLLRRHALGWLVAIVAVQGVLSLVTLPLLTGVYRWALELSAIDGINTTSLVLLLSSPFEVLAFLVYCALAVIAIVAELGFVSALAAALWRGEPFTVRTALGALAAAVRPVRSWQAPILVLYVILVIPVSHLGIGTTLTEHIAIPGSVADTLTGTTAGTIAYWVLVVGLVYVAFRLLLTIAGLVDGPLDARPTILRSMPTSWRLTRRLHLPLAGLLVAAVLAVVAILLVVALLGLAAVAVGQTGGVQAAAVASSVALAVLDLARFVVVGAVTVLVASTLVAVRRAATVEAPGPQELAPPPHPRRPARGPTRAVAAVVLVAGVVGASGQVAAAVAAAVRPADAVPVHTLVIAHRGSTADAVENTLPALRAAAAAHADLVELDVQETADGGLVVSHDTNLRRLAGVDREIRDLTTAEITAIPIRQGGHVSRIPTLQAFVAEAQRLRMPLLVELKLSGRESPGFVRAVTDELRRLDPDESYLVQSLDDDLLDGVRAADPERSTAWVVGLQLGLLPTTDSDAVVIESWSYSDAMLAVARTRDQRVFVWTIDDRADLRAYLGRGVDAVITDDVPLAFAERTRFESDRSAVSRYWDLAVPEITP